MAEGEAKPHAGFCLGPTAGAASLAKSRFHGRGRMMNQLDLIRAAAEDVAAARVLLQERVEVLDAIVQTALEHGVPMAQVDEAKSLSWNAPTPTADEHQALTAP